MSDQDGGNVNQEGVLYAREQTGQAHPAEPEVVAPVGQPPQGESEQNGTQTSEAGEQIPETQGKTKKRKSNNDKIKEAIKWTGKTDPKNLYSEGFLYTLLSVAAVLVSVFIISPRLEAEYYSYLIGGTIAAVLLFLGIFFLNVYQEIFSVRYTITQERIFIYKGVFTNRVDEIEMIQVRDIRINQDFFQRIFGIGDIIVYSGDDTHPELKIEGIRGYYEVKELIRDLVNQMKTNRNMLFSQSIG